VSPGHRRRFLLDSGAVTALAQDNRLLGDYILTAEVDFDGALRIPTPVMGEVRTGDPRYDVVLDRLLKRIAGTDGPYAQLSTDAANRAGVLRHLALKALGEKRDRTRDGKLAIDAFVVAIAEELSRYSAVTILTGDPQDMKLLVTLTNRTNIAVQLIG
jgi:hypothetical protein